MRSWLLAVTCWIMVAQVAAAQGIRPRDVVAAYDRVRIEVIAKVERSVVAIARVRKLPRGATVRRGPNPTSSDFVASEYASGVVVDSAGFVLTTQHVLGDPSKNDYYVFIQKRPYVAKVKATDPWLDLAILSIKPPPNSRFAAIRLGDGNKVRKGQTVLTLGNPFAIARDGEPSVGQGIIANVARKAPALVRPPRGVSKQPTLHHYGTLLQTDAKLNQGTSGGALVDMDGKLIGLITSLAAGARFERAAGFAIPINAVTRRAINTLKQGRQPTYGFLGVQTLDLTAAARRRGRFGVKIRVSQGTPASHGGLRDGDIVKRVNGRPILTRADLTREISSSVAGTVAQVVVLRADDAKNGPRQLTLKVTLGKRYVASHRPGYAEIPLPSWRGAQVDFGTAVPVHVLQDLNIKVDPTRHVVILMVQRDSAAWKAGLRQYDYVSHVGDQRVHSPTQFFAALRGQTSAVRLRIANRKDPLQPVAGP